MRLLLPLEGAAALIEASERCAEVRHAEPIQLEPNLLERVPKIVLVRPEHLARFGRLRSDMRLQSLLSQGDFDVQHAEIRRVQADGEVRRAPVTRRISSTRDLLDGMPGVRGTGFLAGCWSSVRKR